MSEKGLGLLSQLFHSSGEGIMIFNSEGKVVAMNPRSEQIFGYAESELAGQPMEVLIPDDIRKAHVKDRDRFIQNPKIRSMGLGLDIRGKKKNGSLFPLEISLSYLNYQSETLVVAFIIDISLRKEQEELLAKQRKELEGYTAQLEQKVRFRTSELEHLNMGLKSQIQERKLAEEALKKSLEDVKRAESEILKALEKEKELNELKSRFVSMASHEFRTPLTTIASSANLIEKYTKEDHQNKRAKHVDRIKNSVKNLTGILNDFLSLEKLESGMVDLKLHTINLKAQLEEIVEEISLIIKKDQKIIMDGDPDISIRTDAHLFKNMIFNLLSNASKYSDEGKSIALNYKEQKGKIYIEIIDEGIGIPEQEQKNLFGRFFRAENVTNIQGTGLGLHIVKKYVDLLKGNISFKSIEDKGTTFKLTLPN